MAATKAGPNQGATRAARRRSGRARSRTTMPPSCPGRLARVVRPAHRSMGGSMFKHVDYLQFQAKPEKPDALLAAKMQELVGGQFGEMTVMMQYLWQGWNCRVPGKYKDMIMD